MPKFSYKVRDREDRVVLGTMEGASADEVADRLSQKDFLPILVQEIGIGDTLRAQKTLGERLSESFKQRGNRVPYKDVVFFTRQLATMIGQGVPLSKALEQLTRGEQAVFKGIIMQVADDISTGFTFSDAISRHPGAFSPMYVAVAQSGEIAGALDKVLDGLANYMESVEIMRAKVRTAMRYPIFIGSFVTIMMLGIMWKLVPTFETIYSSLGANLPAATRTLMFVSRLVRENTLICLAAGIVAFILFKLAMAQERYRLIFQKNLLRVPVFGSILQKNIWATYCRTMSLLMGAGTPILKATEIAGATVNNLHFTKALEMVYANLRKGELLSTSLEASGLFPVLVIQLVATGEASGRVDALLKKAADFYERETKSVVDNLSSIIEPVLIVVLGSVVGGILFSLYLPIFQIGKFIH